MVNVAIAGIGFMGMIHYLAWQRVPGVHVTAVCSRDPKKRAGDWRGIQGNFGPPGTQMDLSGVRQFASVEELLTDADVDLVDLCLPNSLHCKATLAAAAAGKHVLCEKPIALRSAEAKKMLAACATADKQLLVGHIVPFFPEYAFALSAARSGMYGKLLGGHFKRVISEPKSAKDYFDPNEAGGPLVDLQIHDAHFIRLLFGMPTAVFSRGRFQGEMVEFAESQFVCADRTQIVSTTCGVIRQQGRLFNQAFELHFERATLAYDFAVLAGKPHLATPLTVLDAAGKQTQPELGSPDPSEGFVAELQEAARSVESGKPSDTLSGKLAADALAICVCVEKSIKSEKIERM
jgi:predicted dehydrogenase